MEVTTRGGSASLAGQGTGRPGSSGTFAGLSLTTAERGGRSASAGTAVRCSDRPDTGSPGREPKSLQPHQNPADRSVSRRTGPPPLRGPGQRGFGGRGGAAATGCPDAAGATATSGLSSCCPGNTFCMTGLCETLAVPEQPRHLFGLVRN
ncbi:unnamed protein product [Coccothraustes coccothraustes]